MSLLITVLATIDSKHTMKIDLGIDSLIVFRPMQNGPAVSLYLTLFGIVAGFVSTFWSFGYTRLARRLR
jgi:hypothetical protein